jgi:phosphoglycerate dehydrogenase-like enzyme
MENKLVGIIGIGNIGLKVARRVQGFGARVQYAYHRDTSPLSSADERAAGVVRVPLDELLRTSDIITAHVPRTPQTIGLLNRQALAVLKSGAVLINTSRGDIVDEPALIEALTERRIAGAGLDVFAREPVDPQNPILKLDNVVVTPHVAGTTIDTWSRRLEFAFGNMRRVADGGSALGLVR